MVVRGAGRCPGSLPVHERVLLPQSLHFARLRSVHPPGEFHPNWGLGFKNLDGDDEIIYIHTCMHYIPMRRET